MQMTCIPKYLADDFKKAIAQGDIDISKIELMESGERRELLAKTLKDKALFANTEFERALTLKNTKQGLLNWEKNIKDGGKKPVGRGIVDRITRLDTILTPETRKDFMADLVARRLGVRITEADAQRIVDFTKKMKKEKKGTLAYGTAQGNLMRFMKTKMPKQKFMPVTDTVSILRAIKTGFDLSAPLRQGAALFGTKQWNSAFKNMIGYATNEHNLDMLENRIYGHKDIDLILKYKNPLGMTMFGESFLQREEETASLFIDKIPFLKGSARAYEGFLNDLRFQRFISVVSSLKKSNPEILNNEKAMTALAQSISAATGRGTLGTAEGAAKTLAAALFSPRWITSRVQMLMNPARMRGPAQKEAAKSLARVSGIALGAIALASMAGADVEDDPKSSDFGKIRIGNTRFDMTGGMASYITLMTRIMSGEMKSASSDQIRELSTGKFGSKTRFDLLVDFVSNKASPMAGSIRDALKGRSFGGERIALDEDPKKLAAIFAEQMITPMLYTETRDAFKEASEENKILMGSLGLASSMFGIGASSFKDQVAKPKSKSNKRRFKKLQ